MYMYIYIVYSIYMLCEASGEIIKVNVFFIRWLQGLPVARSVPPPFVVSPLPLC